MFIFTSGTLNFIPLSNKFMKFPFKLKLLLIFKKMSTAYAYAYAAIARMHAYACMHACDRAMHQTLKKNSKQK